MLESEAGGRRELSHEAGVVEQPRPMLDRENLLAAGTQTRDLARPGSRQSHRQAFGVDPVATLDAIEQLKGRIAQRLRETRTQFAGRGRGSKVEYELGKRSTCSARSQSRDVLPSVELFVGFHRDGVLVPPDVVAAKIVAKLIEADVENGRTYSYQEL